jgi:hypothetical protein
MMEFVSWDDDIPNIWKNDIPKPPTRKWLINAGSKKMTRR